MRLVQWRQGQNTAPDMDARKTLHSSENPLPQRLAAARHGNESLPMSHTPIGLSPVTVLLTFDDGLEEHHRFAAPLLEKYGFRGIFNIVTESIGKTVPSATGTRTYMSWEQVRDLVARGHVLGNHTRTHPDLGKLAAAGDIERLRAEILGATEDLVVHVGARPVCFCHPYSRTAPEAEAIIREGGLRSLGRNRKNFGHDTIAFTPTGVGAYLRARISEGAAEVDVLVHGVTREGGGWMPFENVREFEGHLRELRALQDAGRIRVEVR